jgi:group II intron reverse transcriptase/maturase
VQTRRQHIAHIAKKYADKPITTLHHHLDLLWLRDAFHQLKRNSALGLDGISVSDYEQDLDANLKDLLERAKSGKYRATPVKRCYIPKNENESRPIGVPTTERKLLERAVAMLLEPIYEQEFYGCSYGFRPNRGAHQALDEIRATLKQMRGAWVVDIDIRKYFDSIPHKYLLEILGNRIKDSVILRLIGKWLKAGVWEAGHISISNEGTPQGGVISPLLSNIYLHEVLDKWFTQKVKPQLQGQAHLVRFADDFVILVEKREEAQGLLELLDTRFTEWGLAIHPDKSRLVDFRHPWTSRRKPETFDFLGFTHYWGKTRRGGYAVTRKTANHKYRGALKGFEQWCKHNRHKALAWQHRRICEKLKGYCAYYGISGNSMMLAKLRYEVLKRATNQPCKII